MGLTFRCPHVFVRSSKFSTELSRLRLQLDLFTAYLMNHSQHFLSVFQKIKTTTRICPTPKWTLTSGVRRPGRRSASPWRSSQMSWRNITATNSSSQIETSSQQEVSAATVCAVHVPEPIYIYIYVLLSRSVKPVCLLSLRGCSVRLIHFVIVCGVCRLSSVLFFTVTVLCFDILCC